MIPPSWPFAVWGVDIMVYGAEACLPPEIHLGSPRVQAFDESMQEQLRCDDVDLVDE